MNKRSFTTALMSLSLALPLGAATGSSGTSSGTSGSSSYPSSGSSSQRPSSSSSSMGSTDHSATQPMSGMSGATGELKATSREQVDQQFTAKDLIGKDVYDSEGERVGQVEDIALGDTFSSELAQSLSRASQTGSSSSMSGTGSSSSTGSTYPSGSSSSSSMGQSPGSGSSSSGMSSSGMGSSSTGSYSSTTAMTESEPAVFVAVGGVLGIGGDLVRVPIAELSYDTQNERLQVNARKADLTALTEGSSGTYSSSGTAATGGTSSYPGTTGSPSGTTGTSRSSGTYSSSDDMSTGTAAKEQWSDDAQKIRDALRNDATLGSVASQITVTTSGEDVVISGNVESESQKNRIISLAKQSTDKNVRDQLQVQEE